MSSFIKSIVIKTWDFISATITLMINIALAVGARCGSKKCEQALGRRAIATVLRDPNTRTALATLARESGKVSIDELTAELQKL